MNTISKSMLIAEQIADRHGDLHSYLESYLRARETHGIMSSIQIALRQQKNLWDIFSAELGTEFYNRYFLET